ncbi:MAG: HPr family phosphocarrier protein [Acidobacteria bacterium]|nr:HPr family phosphocarrier protein [Acidobacteriota bacterium]
MIERTVRIQNELGLHARAAAKFVRIASQFESDIKVARLNSHEEIDGKSILGILLLAAARGTDLNLRANGRDEEAALEAIVGLIQNKFGEQK